MDKEIQYEEIMRELVETEKLETGKSEQEITHSFGGGIASLICC